MKNLSVPGILETLKTHPSLFNDVALKVFQYQYHNNAIYGQYCRAIATNIDKIDKLEDIPFLPIQFFKKHKVQCFATKPEITFSSSGTGGTQSFHHVKKLSDYKAAFMYAWLHFFKSPNNYVFLPLLPAYSERKGSSLIYMVDALMTLSKQGNKQYYLNDYDILHQHYQEALSQGKTPVIFGVTFALLNLCNTNYSFDSATIIETGGMKGRGKELLRENLHDILYANLGDISLCSEYGMTELLSQAYALDGVNFNCPPQMKVLLRQNDDPFDYNNTKSSGGINIVDLTNLHSCSFIETEDLGRKTDKGFKVLGRFDQSELRGCNLMLSE